MNDFYNMILRLIQYGSIILAITIFAAIDAILFNQHIFYEDHYKIVLIRLFVFIVLDANIGDRAYKTFNLNYLFASLLLFIALFDYILNIFRGLPINYLGTVAYWDEIWIGHEGWLLIIKVVCFILGTWLIFRNREK